MLSLVTIDSKKPRQNDLRRVWFEWDSGCQNWAPEVTPEGLQETEGEIFIVPHLKWFNQDNIRRCDLHVH